MQSQKPLYFSKGIPKKAKKLSRIFSQAVIVLGIIISLLPLVSDAPSTFVYLGVIYIGLGVLIPRTYKFHNMGKLAVMDDCIKGAALSAFNSSGNNLSMKELRKLFQTQTTPFHIPFDQISDIKKGALYILSISSGNTTYGIPVQNKELAYNILCDKVYGEESAKNCVRCGAIISTTTQNCPQCGHLTRYGKLTQQTTANQKLMQNNQITTIIGLAIGVIGLFVFIPAFIELNEISSYASLYAAFHPAESKKLVFKAIAGFILSIIGFSFPISNKLINKLLGK